MLQTLFSDPPGLLPSSTLIALLQSFLRQVPISFFGYERLPPASVATSRSYIASDNHCTAKECPHKLPRHVRLATSASSKDFVDSSQSTQPQRFLGGQGFRAA